MPRQEAPKPNDEAAAEPINRNFALPPGQVEWLRATAFHETTSQAALVREALDDLMRKYARIQKQREAAAAKAEQHRANTAQK